MTASPTILNEFREAVLSAFAKIDFGDPSLAPLILDNSLSGVISQSLIRSAYQGMVDREAIASELSINTAVRPSTIYNEAACASVSPSFAVPAQCTAVIEFPIQMIFKYGRYDKARGIVILELPRQSVYTIGDYHFLAPNTIRIEAIPVANGTTLSSARSYYTADFNLAEYDSANEMLRCRVGSATIMFETRLYQLSQGTIWRNIIAADTSALWIRTVNVLESIAGFKTQYKNQGVTTPIVAQLFHNAIPTTDKYIRYVIAESDSGGSDFSIMFFPLPEWRPPAGSELVTEYFTTGGDVTYSYVGNIKVTPKNETSSLYPGANITGSVLSDQITGGSDFPTLNELKAKIIKHKYLLNTIVTKPDISNALNDLLSPENTEIRVFSARDDVITREYQATVLFKNSDATVIPTNTIDISTTYYELNSFGNCIPASATVIYDSLLGHHRFLSSAELVQDFVNNGVNTYSVPVRMIVNTWPCLKLTPIFESSSDEVVISDKVTQQFFSFMPQTIAVKQKGPHSNLEISAFLSTDIDAYGVADDGTLKSTHLIYRLFFSNPDGTRLGYVDMTPELENGITRLLVRLNPTELFSGANIGYQNPNLKGADGNLLINGIMLPGDVVLSLTVFYDISCSSDEDGSLSDYPEYSSLADLSTDGEYIPIAAFSHSGKITLFKVVSSLAPEIDIRESGAIILRKVPVVGVKAFSDIATQQKFNTRLLSCLNAISLALKNRETNFEVLLKFANSYGFSTKWNCTNTNLRISLKIATFTAMTSSDQELVKRRVREIVGEANSTNKQYFSANELYVIRQEFDVIKYIEVTGIGSQWRQTVEVVDTESDIFEYLNTDNSHLSIEFTSS